MEPAPPENCSTACHDTETYSHYTTTTECTECGPERLSQLGPARSDFLNIERSLQTKASAPHLLQPDFTAEDEFALLVDLQHHCQAEASVAVHSNEADLASTISKSDYIVAVLKGIWRMLITSPRGDRLHWSAICYHVGSQVFVVNSLLAWVAHAYPATELPGQVDYGVGLTTLPGTILFWLGAYFEFLEIVNKAWQSSSRIKKDVECGPTNTFPKVAPCKQVMEPATVSDGESSVSKHAKSAQDDNCHRSLWMPTFQDLISHHIHDTNFHACVIQLAGATVFIMIGMVDLPGISPELTHLQKIGFYWTPDIIASGCFLGASIFFMLGAQDKWYKPRLHSAAWWATAWALVGSTGFLLNGILGPVSYGNWIAEYHCLLAGFWGSVAFLFSSAFQIYDSANKQIYGSPLEGHDTRSAWNSCPSNEQLQHPANVLRRDSG